MSAIQWTDQTFNPLVGCSKVSEGCRNCYAATAAHSPRLQQFPQYQGITSDRGEWTGEVRFVPEVLQKIRRLRKPQRIFMPSMSDMFHPNVKLEWVEQIWKTIADCPHLTFQILTKRPERINEVLGPNGIGWYAKEGVVPCPQRNVWLGATVENQKAADERIPHLLRSPAVVRFLSCEPLLEEIELFDVDGSVQQAWAKLEPRHPLFIGEVIDWVIVGGESGTQTRPMQIEWARSLIRQCKDTGTAVFMKQLGQRCLGLNSGYTGKGGDMDEWPEDLRVREFPAIAQQTGGVA